MPWKEPGKGNKDPWSSGDQPPDLEEVFRNINRRLKGLFGGGGDGRRGGDSSTGGSAGLISVLVIALLLWIGWDSIHIIDQAERGVVLRFGEYNRTLDPGINVTLPRPFETMIPVNISNVRSVEDRGQMLTQDENIVELNYTVQYRVLDPQAFLFNVRDPEPTLQGAAESALRDATGNNRLDVILAGAGREKVSLDTEAVLQDTLDSYGAGIQITEFTLKDVNVPVQVRDAFSDVNRAREDRQRFMEEAQVHANSVVPEARGRAARVIEEAEGYKAANIAVAEGEGQRFNLLLSEYLRAPEVTRKRLYLQTMENVFARSNKILLDVDAAGNVLYLPLDGLGAAAGGNRALMPPLVTPDGRQTGTGRQSGSDESGAARDARREGRQ